MNNNPTGINQYTKGRSGPSTKASNKSLAVAGQLHIKKAIADAKRIFGSGDQNPLVVAKRKKYVRQAANQLSMAAIKRGGRSFYPK